MAKVVLNGHIIVPEEDLAIVKAELATHIELTRSEAGCIVFEVVQDGENECKFNVYEEFTNRNTFAKHQERVRSSKWGAVTVNVDRHYEITDVE
ncbi:MAG: antibiotic biosynthesis monooxygenase [Gammaproteobacteria bacterium]|nr:antibiotic biosynthesis monooxygenase [Gammaproteobacteria bacterium]